MKIDVLVSMAIREALDERGIELTWTDTDAAAAKVLTTIREFFNSPELID